MTDFISGKAAIAGAERRQCELKRELTKTLRIMKLAAVLLFAAAMHVSAEGLTQDKITLSLKNAPMDKVFGEIESQSGFVFIYKDETIRDKKVSIHVTNVSLAEALNECLKGQELSYRIVGKSVAIKPEKKEAELADEAATGNSPPLIDVKGRVLNEKGEPVEGVTVKVRGTEKQTLTDKNGEFSLITVERDAVLIFTHITMETFTLKVSGQSELLINLRTKVSSLGEVVVSVNTGYQQVSKERFVGAYNQLDSAAYNRRAGMDIISRLDGTVTGIIFDKKQQGGNQLSNIQIRGLSTINSSQTPLLIVDNFPFTQDISTINPNDVETITVLKDAAATSIWGARAGNGVIVITTKKGKFNQPLRVSLSSNVSIEDKSNFYYYPKMSVSDFVESEEFLFKKGYYDAALSNTTDRSAVTPVVEMLAKRRAGKLSATDSAIQIDAFKEMDLRRDLNKYVYRNAISQQHFLNLNAGNNLIAYNFSAGYNNNRNNIKNSKGSDQFTLNSSVRIRPIKDLEITNDIRFTQSTNKSAIFSLPNVVYPYMQLADAEGRALPVPDQYRLAYLDTVGGGNLLDWKLRPLDEVKFSDRSIVSRILLIGINVNYSLFKWLSASAGYQYSNQAVTGTNYQSLETYSTRNLINKYTNPTQTTPALRNPIPVGGILDEYNSYVNNYNARGRLDFNKSFGGIHQVQAMVAADLSQTTGGLSSNSFYNYNKENGLYQQTIDYVTVFPTLYTGGASTIPNGNTYRPKTYNRFVSYSGNISYSYNGLYTVYASARKEGSNVFGVNTNKKWKPLWSAGIGWNVSKEHFYDIKWMPLLRLRASYGFSGNPGPPSVTGRPIIEYSTTPAFLTNLTYATPSTSAAPNPDLKWEKVQIVNAGIDFSLFKNRISGTVDIFQKKSTDLISTIPFAPATGVLSFTTNFANLKANGFELNIISRNLDGVLKWQTNFGLSYAKTIVTKLGAVFPLSKARDFMNYAINPAEGKVAYGISSFHWAGLDPMTGDPLGYYGKQVSGNYISILNDSIGNQIFHGSAIPLYSGFVGNTISWKRLTLSANITYRLNFYYRKPSINYSQLAGSGLGSDEYASRWQKPGDEAITHVPSFTYPLNSNRDFFYQNAEINVLRGDNIRLQDIRLQYSINKRRNKIPFNSLQLFLYVNNINAILWRKDQSDWDPDFAVSTKITSAPIPKTWTFGFNLSL